MNRPLLNRDDVREHLDVCQMTGPTDDQLTLLHGHIARELISFNGIDGTYRIGELNTRDRHIGVSAHYFENRQGVTFNENGFVGIAGWASDSNAQPILRGLLKWAEEIKGYDEWRAA